MIEIGQILGYRLAVTHHVLELLWDLGRVAFVVIDSQDDIAFTLVCLEALQRSLLQELIHLIVHVLRGPVDGFLKLFDGVRRQLNLAVARFAVLQGLSLVTVECKSLKVRKTGELLMTPSAR